jgi:hypothetical protein
MEKKYFLLEPKEDSRIVRIFQIVFGIFCILIALFWLVFNIMSGKTESSLWITLIFLIGFGAYQLLAGFGKTNKYIEVGPDKIVMKQNSFLPMIQLKAADIKKIDLFPLNINFLLANRKKINLMFGMTYTDIINPVKEAIIEFAEINKIPFEEKQEEI